MNSSENPSAAPSSVDYKRDVNGEFGKRYLATYLSYIAADERAITEFVVREYHKIKGASAMLDLGCGPGVQHSLPAVPYVARIDMADLLPDNLAELEQWRAGNPDSHNWNHFTKLILELEQGTATPEAIAEREEQLRRKIGVITSANVLDRYPLGEPKNYPVVGFFYCADSTARTKEQWTTVTRNAADMVELGGYLFMTSLRNGDHYIMNHADGSTERIPTVSVNENDYLDALPQFGFERQEIVIESAKTPDMADHGVEEILLVSARRSKRV